MSLRRLRLCTLSLVLALSALRAQTPEPVYTLEPGDQLDVRVLNREELTARVAVRPDGFISLILLEEIYAAGKTVAELRDEIEQGYAQVYRNPRVGLTVAEFSSRKVYVDGDVTRPGAIPLSAGMTAVQAIIQAGGLLKTARPEEAVVRRKLGEGEPEEIRLQIADVLEQGAPDVVLRPADVVYVPRTDIPVFVGGEVLHPGVIAVAGDLTALGAIVQAGGFTGEANKKRVLLLRDGGEEAPLRTELAIKDVLKGGRDTTLQPYDIVFVPKSGIAKVDQAIDQYVRRLIPVTLTAGFSYVISDFGESTIFQSGNDD